MCVCVYVYLYTHTHRASHKLCPKLRQILAHLAKASLWCIFQSCVMLHIESGHCVCEICYVLNKKFSFAVLLHSMCHAKVLPKIVLKLSKSTVLCHRTMEKF